MTTLLDMLSGQLGGNALSHISQQLGTDEQTAGTAVSAALPVLLGALAKNSAKPQGAQALFGALDRDHDGSVLDDVIGNLTGSNQAAGDGILGHVFGARRGQVENNVSRASGLDPAMVTRLMTMLAPLVMGMLGRQKRQQNLDAGGLSDLLANEQNQLQRQNPQLGGLAQMLDSDHDGQIGDDIAKLGKSLLGGLFRRR